MVSSSYGLVFSKSKPSNRLMTDKLKQQVYRTYSAVRDFPTSVMDNFIRLQAVRYRNLTNVDLVGAERDYMYVLPYFEGQSKQINMQVNDRRWLC